MQNSDIVDLWLWLNALSDNNIYEATGQNEKKDAEVYLSSLKAIKSNSLAA